MIGPSILALHLTVLAAPPLLEDLPLRERCEIAEAVSRSALVLWAWVDRSSVEPEVRYFRGEIAAREVSVILFLEHRKLIADGESCAGFRVFVPLHGAVSVRIAGEERVGEPHLQLYYVRTDPDGSVSFVRNFAQRAHLGAKKCEPNETCIVGGSVTTGAPIPVMTIQVERTGSKWETVDSEIRVWGYFLGNRRGSPLG